MVPAAVDAPCATVLAKAPGTDLKALAPATPVPIDTELAAHHSEREDPHTTKGQPYVLIVMHNTTERLLLKHACQVEGCVVHTSETGQKALQILAANGETYALCLIDAVLPDVEPKSFCSQMLGLVRGGAV
jgi:PleD family two-component response regulator